MMPTKVVILPPRYQDEVRYLTELLVVVRLAMNLNKILVMLHWFLFTLPNLAIEFFINSLQYKNGNISNFAVPLEILLCPLISNFTFANIIWYK